MNGSPSSLSAQSILLAIRNGEDQVIEAIYHRHHPVFLRWIVRQGGSPEDAEDIFQEAMMVLYEKAHQADFVLSCQLGTYLFAVGKNRWYKRRQQNQYQDLEVPLEGLEGEVEEDGQRYEEKERYFERLEASLDALGSPCRELLRSFYFKGKSMDTIAEEMGYTNANNTKTQKYKCLLRLRKLFFAAKSSEPLLNEN